MKPFRYLFPRQLILVLLLVLPSAGRAQFTWTNIDGAITITGYTGPGGAITIPATIDGLPVATVGNVHGTVPLPVPAILPGEVVSSTSTLFANNATITSVTIADGIRNISIGAFEGCTTLGSVSLPATISNIGINAFGSCPSLTNLAVAAGNHFYSCRGGVLFNKAQTALLQYPAGLAGSYIIPATVTQLGSLAFGGCTGLTEVLIPQGVTNIPSNTFGSCTNLTGIVVLPGNADYRSVNGVLFNRIQSILLQYPGGRAGNFVVPQGVTIIGSSAFEDCAGLTGISLPDTLASVENEAFANCTGLTNVVIPDGVGSIGVGAFQGCQGLVTVTLGENLTILGGDAFSGCVKLTGITLPDSLASIGLAAFQLCYALDGITIPNGVVSIGASAFSDTGLTNVVLGSGVSVLADEVFANDRSLTNVTLTGRVTSFGQGVFEECSGLTTFTIPDSVTNIGSSAFAGTSLASITIPTNVTSIGISAFGSPYFGPGLYGIPAPLIPAPVIPVPVIPPPLLPPTLLTPTAIRSSVIPYSETSPPLQAINVAPGNPAYASVNGVLFKHDLSVLIEYPDGLTGSYTIPAGVTGIETNAFAGSSQLTGITIPAGVASIGDNAFEQCSELGSVSLPDSVTNLGNNVFAQCTALTNVVIGQGVTSLGTALFQSCNTLAEVRLGGPVTSIGSSAFTGCTDLAGLALSEGLLSIGVDAFLGSGLTNVVIPAGVTHIGLQAFADCNDLTAIMAAAGNRDYSSVGGVLFNVNQTSLLQYPGAATGVYTVPSTVTTIGNDAFQSCYGLTGVTVPAGVTNLGAEVFWYCSDLTNVFFAGNAPAVTGQPFVDDPTSVTYEPGISGWTNTFGGVPAAAVGAPTGALRVTIEPGDFRLSEEASWQVDGGMSHQGNQTVTGLTVGAHTVSFASVQGWTNPASQTVLVTANATNLVTGTYGGINQIPPPSQFLFTTNEGGITITSYEGSDQQVTIPDTINGLPVTGIGASAFEFDFVLDQVIIPPRVTRIGDNAFQGCNNLTTATFPAGLTNIGDFAFANCNYLDSLTLPNHLTSIGQYAFIGASLTNVVIPNSVTSLGDYAFAQCFELASVTLPDGLTSLGNAEFQFCDSLTNITIPASITNIGYNAFYDCTNLTGVYFLGNGPEFGYDVFDYISVTLYYLPWATGWPAYIEGVEDEVTTLPWHPPIGSLLVTIQPAAADGAQWNVDGGSWQNSGVTVSNVLTGSHTVTFIPISGWTPPTSITVQVASNVTTTTSGTYVQVPGAVQVIINPTAAASAGAEWRVNGGAWQTNGATVGLNLAITQAAVAFNTIHGWTSPASQNVAVSAGQTNVLTVNYAYNLRPTFRINNLAGGQAVSNTVYTVTGNASDPTGVAGVWYQINGGGWLPAAGTTNWSATVALVSGINLFEAFAVDTSSNVSSTTAVNFRCIPSAILNLQVSGVGAVSPNYSNAVLAVGRQYHMTATAVRGSGFTFTNWTGFNIYTLTSQLIETLGPVLETNYNTSTIISPTGVLTNGPTLELTMAAPQIIYASTTTDASGDVITNNSLTVTQGYQANFVDVEKPVLQITSPTANALVNTNAIVIQGTASDNAAVASVWYQFNGAGWQNPTGTNSWSVPVALNPGTNTIQAYAVDTSGNVSATNTVNLIYVVMAPFFLTINGQGTVNPNYSGQQLQVGENYTMTALPARGFAFTNWYAVSLIQPQQTARPRTDTPYPPPIVPYDPPFYLTNSPNLQFTMGGFLAYIANFVDIAPPVVTITAPTPNERVSNLVFTVIGTARDNAGVAVVYYQLNGAGWQSASTGDGYTNWFTPNLSLLPGATNLLQICAVDTSGNISATNSVQFLNLQQDPAPDSLANTLANGRSFLSTGFTFSFGTNTFSLAPYVSGQSPSVGHYTYSKLSPATGRLVFASTAPPSAVGEPVTLDLAFTDRDSGTYSNEASGDTGRISFSPFSRLIPDGLSGKTMLLFNSNGVASTLDFAGATLSFINTAGDGGAADFVFQPVSPISGLLTWGDATQGTNYLVLLCDFTNVGNFYASAFDAEGNAAGAGSGIYALPSGAPSAPDSLSETEAQRHSNDSSESQIDFGIGTYSQLGYASPPTASVGNYAYLKNGPAGARLSLASAGPPGSIPGGQLLQLNFVTSECCWFTNPAASTSNIECLVFFPVTSLAPASVTRLTLYATNYTERFINNQSVPTVDTFVFLAHGCFLQLETAGSDQELSSGSWQYQVYSPVGAVFQLKYGSPGLLKGATNYLQATFYDSRTGLLNGSFFDQTGDPPVRSVAGFSLH